MPPLRPNTDFDGGYLPTPRDPGPVPRVYRPEPLPEQHVQPQGPQVVHHHYHQAAPIVQRPWGAYIALGTLGTVALTAFVIWSIVALIVVAILAVVLSGCLVIVRSMWREHLADGEKAQAAKQAAAQTVPGKRRKRG